MSPAAIKKLGCCNVVVFYNNYLQMEPILRVISNHFWQAKDKVDDACAIVLKRRSRKRPFLR